NHFCMNETLHQIFSSLKLAFENQFLNYVELAPGILGALGILLVGYLMAHLVYKIIIATAEKLRLEVLAEKIGLSHFLEKHNYKASSSHVIAKSFKGYLIF